MDCNYAIPATYCGSRLVPLETVQAVIEEVHQMAASFIPYEGAIGPEELGKALLWLEEHCASRTKS